MPERESPNAMGRIASVWVLNEGLRNFPDSPDLVGITIRIGWESQERSCLLNLLDVRIMPANDVPLQVSDSFIRLTEASEFNILLEPEVKLQRAL